MTDFTAFMQVFTATHITYLCIIPCFIALLGLLASLGGQLSLFNANNLFLVFFIAIFLIMASAKVFKTIDKAPYIEKRMHQFQFIEDKEKKLSY